MMYFFLKNQEISRYLKTMLQSNRYQIPKAQTFDSSYTLDKVLCIPCNY